MAFGVALMVLGALGTSALVGFAAAASSEGTLGLGPVAMSSRAGMLLAGSTALVATASFLLGLHAARRARQRRTLVVVADQRASEAERDAHARLLSMRLEQLQREVELLELRRAGALGELQAPMALIDGDDGDEPVVIVVPEDDQEPTVLGLRLAAAQRASLRA